MVYSFTLGKNRVFSLFSNIIIRDYCVYAVDTKVIMTGR